MQGNRRCSGAWWAISIEDGVRVHWHANVCAPAIYSPPAHLHCSHLCPWRDCGGRPRPGLAGGNGPRDMGLHCCPRPEPGSSKDLSHLNHRQKDLDYPTSLHLGVCFFLEANDTSSLVQLTGFTRHPHHLGGPKLTCCRSIFPGSGPWLPA